MSVKLEVNETKGIITFAEGKCNYGHTQACLLQKYNNNNKFGKFVSLYDGDSEAGVYNNVTVNSKDHAKALIKALNKSIELGWLE